MHFDYRAVTFFGVAFQQLILYIIFITLLDNSTFLSYYPIRYYYLWFGLLRFRSPLLAELTLFSFPLGTEMFHFPRCAPRHCCLRYMDITPCEFPHSEISGSKVVRHLPETYRRLTTSFIACKSQGIHRMLLIMFLLGNICITHTLSPLTQYVDCIVQPRTLLCEVGFFFMYLSVSQTPLDPSDKFLPLDNSIVARVVHGI